MKSLKYYGPGWIQLEDTPVPKIKSGEVLVAVEACGICATDVKTFLGGHPKIRPGSGLGHEISGIVAESPDSSVWRPGTRVTVAPYVPCGLCDQCKKGRYSLCPNLFNQLLDPGGFSEFVRVPEPLASKGMIALPESLASDASCFAEPVACCLHAFSSIHVVAGESLVIIGDGVMGLLQAEIAHLLGANPIMLSGMTPERMALAEGVADVVIDARNEDVGATVMRMTGGEGADKVIVSVAVENAAELAVKLVRKGGAINLFAGMPSGSTLALDMNRIHYDEVLLTGSFGFGPDDFRTAVDLISSGKLNVTRLVTSSVSLTEAVNALEKLSRQEGLKTIVHCRDGGGES
ncbi:MAG: alcohol dehydrogenase catalytic domain-containing protein [Terriglobales bacterium]